ncbi:hypothetical protein [Streptomyces sp. AK02-04a]|nr:hypothetical protein [Streptomyces sp. AK02-04a]MDX3763622.1 hypothetical protein [Streptomyces sp. AK02-04a]
MRKHFEAMVFTALAEELRTGDVALVGSEEYADWSKQLLDWAVMKEKLGSYLVEVGLCEEGESAAFDAKDFRQQWEDELCRRGGCRVPGQRGAWSSTSTQYPVAETAPFGGDRR